MDNCSFVKDMRIAILYSYSTISNKYDEIRMATGKSVYIEGGHIIQLLLKTFPFLSFYVIGNDFIGEPTPDGNWTGCIGSLQRNEADIAICSIAVTEERSKVVAFTHPYMYTPVTFASDKPQNIPNRFAIFYTFSWRVWLALFLCFLFLSIFIYMFFRRKGNYSTVFLNMLGIGVEQSFQLKSRLSSVRFIMMSWIIGVMCLTYSYKAVLLSSFSLPNLSGVRDIKELSEAAQNPSFHCFCNKHSYIYKSLVESDSELIKPIAECLKRTPDSLLNYDFLLNSAFKKAHIDGKFNFAEVKRKLFISDDTFFTGMAGVAVNKNYPCFNALNDFILKIYEAGFIQRYQSHKDFLIEIKDKSSDYDISPCRILRMDDLFGAFIILSAGLFLSTLILVIEIIFNRLTKS